LNIREEEGRISINHLCMAPTAYHFDYIQFDRHELVIINSCYPPLSGFDAGLFCSRVSHLFANGPLLGLYCQPNAKAGLQRKFDWL